MERSQTGCLAFLSKYIVIEFDKEEAMKHYNIITAILFLLLAGLWLYLGLARQGYYVILSLLSVIVAIVHVLRHMKEKRK